MTIDRCTLAWMVLFSSACASDSGGSEADTTGSSSSGQGRARLRTEKAADDASEVSPTAHEVRDLAHRLAHARVCDAAQQAAAANS